MIVILNCDKDYYGNFLVPGHHGEVNELKMPPCDDSEAAQSTVKDRLTNF